MERERENLLCVAISSNNTATSRTSSKPSELQQSDEPRAKHKSTMAKQKLRIILIAGSGRSGSTLLDNILGQTPGFFSGGELGNLWDFAREEARLCACGTRLRECEIWSGIFRRLYKDMPLNEVFGTGRDHYRYMRLQDLWRLTTERGRQRFLQLAADYAREALDIYQAIADQTGAHTIVDSSKGPARTYLINQIPELDVYTIHLVRDARAVAFSGRRKKPDPSLPNSYQHFPSGPVNVTIRWILSHQVERLCKTPGRYLMIRYEDFVAAPDREILRIFGLIGAPAEERATIANHTVRLMRVHSINGNPSRFIQNAVTLKPDDEWRSKMSRFDRALVSALAWYFNRRFGYELNGGVADPHKWRAMA
jgi:Sulfotransferase family